MLQHQGKQCTNTRAWETKAREITGDQPHGVEKSLSVVKKNDEIS